MKATLYLFLFLAIATASLQSQQGMQDIVNIPGETIYIHHNTRILFAGEHLYYKAYCRNAHTGDPSTVSKIAYVGLLNRNRETVLLQKIRVQEGQGSGDFFIPAELPTGSYKVIGFTEWMKNNTQSPVFLSDIILINPYAATPPQYLPEISEDSTARDAVALAHSLSDTGTGPSGAATVAIQADLDNPQYGKRERVTWTISQVDRDIAQGQYSLSVRRLPDLLVHHLPSPDPALQQGVAPIAGQSKTATSLPEMRGELLSGTVRSRSGAESVRHLEVALSLPGDQFIFEIARTDANGRFYFNLPPSYEPEQGILQLLHPEAESFEIVMEPVTPPLPQSLSFYDFQLAPEWEERIRERSITNQIENAYVEIKPDTVLPFSERKPFYREYQLQYTLDDYTRFNTIAETLVEVVDHVWLTTDPSGEPLFQVRPFDGYLDGVGMSPMVFMDGLFIQNHSDIVHFPSRQIKNIFISRDRYQIGANVFQGLLAFETFSSDFPETFYRDFLTRYSLFKPQPPKAYYFQTYSNEDSDRRIPDFRRQLHWNPEFQLPQSGTTVHWYTSDLPGRYRIRLEGFTASGRPVSYQQDFYVE